MSKIVKIFSRKFLGDYCYAQSSERIPEPALFIAGALLTVALPQIIFAAYGITTFNALAGSAAIGSVLGWANSRREPDQFITCVARRDVPQAPPAEDAANKDAA